MDGSSAIFRVSMKVSGEGDPTTSCSTTSSTKLCGPASDQQFETTTILTDTPGTVKNLGPDQKQAQADVLKRLCDAGLASCSFTPTAEDHILSGEHVAGEAGVNPGDFDMKTTIEAEDSVGESDSVGVEITAGVEKVVVAEVTAKYEHEWTHEHTFSQSFEVKIPPHSKVWFTHQAPTIRDTGDFTVKFKKHHLESDRRVLRPSRPHRSGETRAVHPPPRARQRARAGVRQGAPGRLLKLS